MRAAFYNHTSEISGAEISMMLTARHMSGCETIICAPDGELLEAAAQSGLQTAAVTSYRARLSKNPFLLLKDAVCMLYAALIFALQIRKLQADIIHANSIRAGLIASAGRWLHRKPVIWHIRDHLPGGIIGHLILLFAKRTADGVIGISQAVLAPALGKLDDSACFLVYNGMEITGMNDIERQEARKRLRQEFTTGENQKAIAVIGQIAPWKRQEDAIHAVSRLVSEGEDVKLWIVGEAKFREDNARYEDRIKELVQNLGLSEKVTFTGFRSDVLEICCAADLLVLCSDNEPFGRVLIEAMSQQIPVIATNGGGVPEIVEHGRSGYLYRIGDIGELTRYIRRLIGDEVLRRSMGKAGASRVEDMFDIVATARNVNKAYAAILGDKAGHRPRVCIVHDYLIQMGGAERVVAVLHRMFPEAPVYTTVADRDRLLDELRDADIRTSWMQRIPGIRKHFKFFFWLYPLAVRTFSLRGFDLIISSSSAYAKGIAKPKGARHITYCHTPMRFAWDYETYIRDIPLPGIVKRILKLWMWPLRWWDIRTSKEIDHIIANSTVVKERIEKYYKRSAAIIYPPVELSRFECSGGEPEPYFLIVSRLVSYKRIDVAVEACTRLQMNLMVIGDGPDRSRLESLAGSTVRFLGRLSDDEVVRYMKNCRAFIFPGLEDFGITPLEANACGRPVIAYRGGGALDTIRQGLNGTFFSEQHADSLAEVLRHWDDRLWDSERIRSYVERFDTDRFILELQELLQTGERRLVQNEVHVR